MNLSSYICLQPSAGTAAPVATDEVCTTTFLFDSGVHRAYQSTTQPATYLVSHEQMMHWIATTDAELTFIGTPIKHDARSEDAAQSVMVTYCSSRARNATA